MKFTFKSPTQHSLRQHGSLMHAFDRHTPVSEAGGAWNDHPPAGDTRRQRNVVDKNNLKKYQNNVLYKKFRLVDIGRKTDVQTLSMAIVHWHRCFLKRPWLHHLDPCKSWKCEYLLVFFTVNWQIKTFEDGILETDQHFQHFHKLNLGSPMFFKPRTP